MRNVILTCLLSSIGIASCGSGKKAVNQTNNPIESIQFGSGGGVTGAREIFTLNANGQINKGKENKLVLTLPKNVTDSAFEMANKIKINKIAHPENLYRFLSIYSKVDNKAFVWGLRDETTMNSGDSLQVINLYKYLNKFVNPNLTQFKK